MDTGCKWLYMHCLFSVFSYHPDNMDTLACPLGVRINWVPLYLKNLLRVEDLFVVKF